MKHSEYLSPAELYLGSDAATALAQGPRNFRTALQALRFAVEHAAPVSLRGARLKVGEHEFIGREFKALHRNASFPQRPSAH
jgi:hypothetical protein